MKKKFVAMICLAASLLMCACGAGQTSLQENVGKPLAQEEITVLPTDAPTVPDTTQEETTAPVTTEEPTVPVTAEQPPAPVTTTAPQPSEFKNDYNVVFTQGEVTIRPKHVYYKDGILYAQCFIINGTEKPVLNVRVNALIFSNKVCTIADGDFGTLNTPTIQPNSYITWTFSFGGAALKATGQDLSSLHCKFDLDYLN